jgi:hypothetical protein
MFSPTQSVVSDYTETIQNSPTLYPVSLRSPVIGFERCFDGLPVVMSEALVKQDGGLNNHYAGERKRKRDDSVGSDTKRKGEVKGYHNTLINLTVFLGKSRITLSNGSFWRGGVKMADELLLFYAQQGLVVEREIKKQKIEEEKRWLEEETRRIEKARVELEKERDAILSNELQKYLCCVREHLQENVRLSEKNSLYDLFRNSVEKGEDGIYMENAEFELVKVTTTFTVDLAYRDTLHKLQI